VQAIASSFAKVQSEMSADGFKWADLQSFSILSAAESIGIKHQIGFADIEMQFTSTSAPFFP
jgi:hypothetical protein